MTYDEVIRQARTLSHNERTRLIAELARTLTDYNEPEKKRSVLEFEGFAAEAATDEDSQDYINRIRDEWDQ